MRPQSDARRAIVGAIEREGPAALADVVQRTGLGYGTARQVLSNCVRAGELTYKLDRRPHARRPVAVYEPAAVLDDLAAGPCWHELAGCVAGWR